MKLKTLVTAVLTMGTLSSTLVASEMAAPTTSGEKNSIEKQRYRYPRYPRRRPAPRRHYDDRVVIATTCAPEVLNGNISATERVLNEIAASNEFANATTFKNLVASISAEQDAQKKIDAYFDLVGVETTEDMAYFVGARDEELRDYAAVLAANAELSQAQAETVASKLATSLRGGLR